MKFRFCSENVIHTSLTVVAVVKKVLILLRFITKAQFSFSVILKKKTKNAASSKRRKPEGGSQSCLINWLKKWFGSSPINDEGKSGKPKVTFNISSTKKKDLF